MKTTIKELELMLTQINSFFPSGKKVILSRRYGYFALDTENGHTIATGLTKNECYNILKGMDFILTHSV